MTEMNKSFSLLFSDPSEPHPYLYDEKTVAFAGGIPAEDPFLKSELEDLLRRKTTRKDVAFRKEILEDLLQTPSLLTKLETIQRRWEDLSRMAQREKTVEYTAETTPETVLSALKDDAVCLMEHLRFLKRASEELNSEQPTSQGLFRLQGWFRRCAQSETLKALTEEISSYPLLTEDNLRAVLHVNLDGNGSWTETDVAFLGMDTNKYLRKNPPKKDDLSAELPLADFTERTTAAICRLTKEFGTLTREIRSAVAPLGEGLRFYQFALSLIDWATERNVPWQFATPTSSHGPMGKELRNPAEKTDGIARPTETVTAKILEVYRGDSGVVTLQTVARTQLYAAASLPIFGKEVFFCPEETLLLYSSEEKTVDNEIEALAAVFHQTKKQNIVLLDRPLITVGTAPAAEIIGNLLRAFHKKGACVRINTDLLSSGGSL